MLTFFILKFWVFFNGMHSVYTIQLEMSKNFVRERSEVRLIYTCKSTKRLTIRQFCTFLKSPRILGLLQVVLEPTSFISRHMYSDQATYADYSSNFRNKFFTIFYKGQISNQFFVWSKKQVIKTPLKIAILFFENSVKTCNNFWWLLNLT